MKILNANRKIVWTYDMLCEKYRKQPAIASRITCNIVVFAALLNDDEAILHFDPVTKMAILRTGHYANIEIDGQWLKVYVDKSVDSNDVIFS